MRLPTLLPRVCRDRGRHFTFGRFARVFSTTYIHVHVQDTCRYLEAPCSKNTILTATRGESLDGCKDRRAQCVGVSIWLLFLLGGESKDRVPLDSLRIRGRGGVLIVHISLDRLLCKQASDDSPSPCEVLGSSSARFFKLSPTLASRLHNSALIFEGFSIFL